MMAVILNCGFLSRGMLRDLLAYVRLYIIKAASESTLRRLMNVLATIRDGNRFFARSLYIDDLAEGFVQVVLTDCK